jgi:hypothetical protein
MIRLTLMGRTLWFLSLLIISQAHSKIFATTNLKTSWGTFIWESHNTMIVSSIILSFKTFENVWHCVTNGLKLSIHSKRSYLCTQTLHCSTCNWDMMKYFVLKSVVKNLGMHDNDINNGWLDYEKKNNES